MLHLAEKLPFDYRHAVEFFEAFAPFRMHNEIHRSENLPTGGQAVEQTFEQFIT